MHSREEVVKGSYKDYQNAAKKGKKEILARLVSVTGMNRDYLAFKLSHYQESAFAVVDGKPVKLKAVGKRKARVAGKRGGRPTVYDATFVKVLTAIWADHGRPCGKLLVPTIREMIYFLESSRNPNYEISGKIREQLLRISPACADILLQPAKKDLEIRGISTTRSKQTPLRSQIPVKTYFDRSTTKPGDFAFDTVAHCGGSASGQFCKTLTGCDPFSGWIEERSLLNAANHWVKEAISDIQDTLPFPMKSAHYDNGMEFINAPLLQWCLERHITMTRSRPYHKNDNCYAEQKNYDAVRKTVGYFRFDTPCEQAALAEVYNFLCPLYNYWYPSFKLVDKVQQADGRYKKIYEKSPKTPFQRLLESQDISEECKGELRRRKSLLNPVELNRNLNEAIEKLLQINRDKIYTEGTSCKDVA